MAAMGLTVAALFAVAWILGQMNLRQLTLHYREPRRVESGKGFSGKLMLTNEAQAFDGFWIEFRILLLGEKYVTGKSPLITGKGSAEIRERVVLRKRGLAMSHIGRLRSGFPLGLMVFTREVEVAT